MDSNLSFSDRLLIAAAYVLCFPALHIILTERRKNAVYASHAAQALFLWIFIFATIIILRVIIFVAAYCNISVSLVNNLINIFFFVMWIYALRCGFLFLIKRSFKIPLITDISSRLA
jgi:small-conductance mechanosensitive channel